MHGRAESVARDSKSLIWLGGRGPAGPALAWRQWPLTARPPQLPARFRMETRPEPVPSPIR